MLLKYSKFRLSTLLLVSCLIFTTTIIWFESRTAEDMGSPVWRIIEEIESLEKPIGYDEFIERLKLATGTETPPTGGGLARDRTFYWPLSERYELWAQFGRQGGEFLEFATIDSRWEEEGKNHSNFSWVWRRTGEPKAVGSKNSSEDFEGENSDRN